MDLHQTTYQKWLRFMNQEDPSDPLDFLLKLFHKAEPKQLVVLPPATSLEKPSKGSKILFLNVN